MGITKITYPLASDLAVLFCVPIPHLRPFPLKALKCSMAQEVMQDGSEAAAFAFAAYRAAASAFKTPKKTGSIKVTSMSVRTADEHLYIRWNTAPSAVNIKRTVKLFAEALCRSTAYKNAFFNNIALLGKTTDYKENFTRSLQTQVFNHIFDALIKSLRAGKYEVVCISKNFNLDKDLIPNLETTLKSIFDNAKLLGDGKAPVKHECTVPMSPHFKCSGWGAILAVLYLRSFGVAVEVHDDIVEVYAHDPRMTAKVVTQATNAHKIARYLADLSKPKELITWLMYEGIVSDIASVGMLMQLHKDKPTLAEVQSKLKHVLSGEFFKHK